MKKQYTILLVENDQKSIEQIKTCALQHLHCNWNFIIAKNQFKALATLATKKIDFCILNFNISRFFKPKEILEHCKRIHIPCIVTRCNNLPRKLVGTDTVHLKGAMSDQVCHIVEQKLENTTNTVSA